MGDACTFWRYRLEGVDHCCNSLFFLELSLCAVNFCARMGAAKDKSSRK